MHVFITGGTGTIGSAVVAELLGHGHSVLALARSEDSARAVEDAGAEALRGGLADLDVVRAGARRSDGVISLAFGRDYASPGALARAIDEETAAVAALGEELTGSGRPIATVSGTPWVPGRAATEADPLPTDGPVGGRGRAVTALLDLAWRGVRSTAVRMPRTVHHEGRGGFAGLLTDAAPPHRSVRLPRRRRPAVAGRARARRGRPVPGWLSSRPRRTSWHAVGDEGDAVRDIATVIGRRLGLPVEAVPEETFGPFGPIFAMDQPASAAHTRAALGWQPTHPGLLADLENIRP